MGKVYVEKCRGLVDPLYLSRSKSRTIILHFSTKYTPKFTPIIPFSTKDMSSSRSEKDSGVPEAIAIVGMSCRLSGIATSPEGLWQMLSKGITGWTNSGGSRFHLDAFWHPQGDLSGSVSK